MKMPRSRWTAADIEAMIRTLDERYEAGTAPEYYEASRSWLQRQLVKRP